MAESALPLAALLFRHLISTLDGYCEATKYHDETLPARVFQSAEFCGMCGPKFCSMHHSRTIEEGIAQMTKEREEKGPAKLAHGRRDARRLSSLSLPSLPLKSADVYANHTEVLCSKAQEMQRRSTGD